MIDHKTCNEKREGLLFELLALPGCSLDQEVDFVDLSKDSVIFLEQKSD